MDDNWPSMVANSVSHPTVDDLGLVLNTRCNLRVVLSPPFRRYPFDRGIFVPSSGRRLPVALLVPARRPQTPKLRRRCAANPHFVSLCLQGTVAAAATPPSLLSSSPIIPLSSPPTVCLLFCRCCCCCCCFRWIFVFSCSLLPLICN